MYIPSFFKIEDKDKISDFISQNGFGIIISKGNDRLLASHIPMLFTTNEKGEHILTGHLSKANPQWKTFDALTEVLTIFQGAHSYISSSWYDHNNVPTWNYMAVHIYGHLRLLTEDELLTELRKMTDKYEADSSKPVSVDKMEAPMLAAQLRGIVGFEIKVNEVHAAYKLSQNRDDKNHSLIIDELEKKGDENSLHIAAEMKKNRL
ncbi:MAG: transcriptional regulator [Chitinophagaceae bacterium]|nr:transcriptional regulator [Chitinophagaceae bacterium]